MRTKKEFAVLKYEWRRRRHSCDCPECGVDQRVWVTAFTAYREALAKPYFGEDHAARKANEDEVQRCFDVLVELSEGA